ncbi:putative zinc-finger containing protein [Kosakonia phage Kc304]|nr:putative zinc-finger containing protein [Kosakonia phage Kc304]UYM28755.1 putative C4-type zinc finger containing protein [Serratia phage vB_SspM_LC53]
MNGWGPSDEGFATREAVVNDAVDWARLELELASKRESAEFCEECDEPIPLARRKAVPGCLLCVECQSKADNVVKSYYNRRGSKDSQLR